MSGSIGGAGGAIWWDSNVDLWTFNVFVKWGLAHSHGVQGQFFRILHGEICVLTRPKDYYATYTHIFLETLQVFSVVFLVLKALIKHLK